MGNYTQVCKKSDYYVSDRGQVFKRQASGNFRELKLQKHSGGYSYWNKPKKENCPSAVHLLVAKHFVPNPDKYKRVKHIDGNRRNNHYSNLQWITEEEFIFATRPNVAKIDSDAVKDILTSDEPINKLAQKYGISDVLASNIKHRKAWTHVPAPRGYKPPTKYKKIWGNADRKLTKEELDMIENDYYDLLVGVERKLAKKYQTGVDRMSILIMNDFKEMD